MNDILQLIKVPDAQPTRFKSGLIGFDNLLGGGFVAGETLILAGEPGSGKSSLMMQVANGLAMNENLVLYVCGEESLGQVKARANRFGVQNPEIWVSEAINLEELYQAFSKTNPQIIIIDSLQMLYSSDKKQDAGSPTQMRYCLRSLISYAKENEKILIVIGHSTKTGLIAGLLTLQHMVDAVLFLTVGEEGNRVLQVKKNRFGAAQTDWELLMTEKGLVDKETGEGETEVEFKEVRVPYKVIRTIIDSSGKLNRYAVSKDLEWLIYQFLGRKLSSIEQYDIILKIRKQYAENRN